MPIMATKKIILGLASTNIVNMARQIRETSSALAEAVMARAASALVNPRLVIISGRKAAKVKSLVNTKLIPRHMFRKGRSLSNEKSMRLSSRRRFLKI
jgi:hypothetical protein